MSRKQVFLVLIILGLTGTLLYFRPASPSRKKPTLRKKFSVKEEVALLIQALQSCSEETEPLLIEELRRKTGFSFGYRRESSREEKIMALGKWIKWWQKEKDFGLSEWLVHGLQDSHYKNKAGILRKMKMLPSYPEGVESLINTAKNSLEAPEVRVLALEVLAKWRAKEGLLLFQEMTKENSSDFIAAGLKGLASLKFCPSNLQDFLHHPSPKIRIEAAHLAWVTKGKKAFPMLLDLLQDEDEWVVFEVFSLLEDEMEKTKLQKEIQSRSIQPSLKKKLLARLK
ncbi:MAG: HEAT repeat domain-containing protein [Planctomycetota bacterium]|nr:MAG: HEAT repeat domain-containing protein [Planctomycetota bacterium]